MPTVPTDRLRVGVRRAPTALVSIVAANTNTTLYSLTAGRTCFLRKLMIYNRSGGTALLSIGTADSVGVFTAQLPLQSVANNAGLNLTEDQLVEYEFTSSVVVRSNSAAASPNEVQAQGEVEELAV